MKKIITFAGCLALALFAFFAVPSKTYAMEPGFDAGFYAANNPDVVAVYGTDPEMLYQHYNDYGRAEGRAMNGGDVAAAPAEAPAPEAPPVVANLPYPTYVDVDIANQTVTYYENNVAVMSTGCVTGNASLGRDTPRGTFTILSHVAGKTLTGPTWRVWVDYWMPFTRSACGLHDATWRSAGEFGGSTYINNGSHGCVNLPHDFAANLFNRVNVGTIVYVH